MCNKKKGVVIGALWLAGTGSCEIPPTPFLDGIIFGEEIIGRNLYEYAFAVW
jgi:hypothetical protein